MASSVRPVVCSYGRNSQLLNLRSLVLEGAGFDVHTATESSELEKWIKEGSIALFLLCHQLSESDCRAAIDRIDRESPQSAILVIKSGNVGPEDWLAHRVLNALDGPDALISAVRSLVQMYEKAN
jgi:CheY-like chemotaxis protein